ncbi:hypothetical protein [Chitinophaga sp. S165]|uniref:hypothetical protein n=1 Tax=Chitinophaga sp. S165 TaxID=2135462 RepID=UPI000D718B4C|nr:hypothetical protein [Chitinophaga sp. S165]PWV51547.1 hypothetical protein C7475_103156 [Chitinophaga sp. S165]
MNIKIDRRVLANVIIAGAFAVHGIRTIAQDRLPVRKGAVESIRTVNTQLPDSALANLRQRISIRM